MMKYAEKTVFRDKSGGPPLLVLRTLEGEGAYRMATLYETEEHGKPAFGLTWQRDLNGKSHINTKTEAELDAGFEVVPKPLVVARPL